jgi:hypothetical protein
MEHEEKVAYVQNAMSKGAPSYFGLSENEISQMPHEHLEIELDCARNWMGED